MKKLFVPGPIKDYVTVEVDLKILKFFFGHKNDLHYIGLAGGHCNDIIRWNELIGSADVIEKDQESRNQIPVTFTKPELKRIAKNLNIYDRSIEDEILDKESLLRLPGHIVNFDFIGSAFVYEHNREENDLPRRMEAILDFIRLQANREIKCNFVIILTVQAQRNDDTIISDLLEEADDAIDGEGNNKKDIFIHLNSEEANQLERLIVIIPILIISSGLNQRFEVSCENILTYIETGKKTRMLHFVLTFTPSNLRIRRIKSEHLVPIPIRAIQECTSEGLGEYKTNIPPYVENL